MSAKATTITPLGYALLGLISADARSGYALRKVFETTPLGNYSSSPGSIYPALKSLQKRGLIVSRPGPSGKNLFFLTLDGEKALDGWLRAQVSASEDSSIAMLRFALLQFHPDRSLTLEFLSSFAEAARTQWANLNSFLAGDAGLAMPLQSRLAVGFGAALAESSARWAMEAHRQLKDEIAAQAAQPPKAKREDTK